MGSRLPAVTPLQDTSSTFFAADVVAEKQPSITITAFRVMNEVIKLD